MDSSQTINYRSYMNFYEYYSYGTRWDWLNYRRTRHWRNEFQGSHLLIHNAANHSSLRSYYLVQNVSELIDC